MTSQEPDPSVAVSVIVPVYNTRDHLARCLDSVLGQTLRAIQVIVVDDGSSDGCGEIVDRYAATDPRITIVRHARNEGLHLARISGFLAARGEYIGYVDSDDYVARDMFAGMYATALERHADVVRTGARLEPEPRTLSFAERIYPSGVDYLDEDFYPSMWLHLHHRRLWQLALPHFPRIRVVGEDNLTSFVLAYFARCVVSLPHVGYVYVERSDSISSARTFDQVAVHIQDRATIVKLLRNFIDANGGRADRAWRAVAANNRGLLFAFVDALDAPADRRKAGALFESAWNEPLPAEQRCRWQMSAP